MSASEDLRARAQRFAAERPERPATPADEGQVLARIDRGDGSEIRVSLHRYREAHFLRIAPWRNGWPDKGKSETVRVRELAAVADGIAAAFDALDTERGR